MSRQFDLAAWVGSRGDSETTVDIDGPIVPVPPVQHLEIKELGRRSGGSRGGRPVKAVTDRGMAGGHKSNRRQLGQSVLRRDPTAQQKLSVCARISDAVADAGGDLRAVRTVQRDAIEVFSGFAWRTAVQWWQARSKLEAVMSSLRLGKWGQFLSAVG